MNIEAKKINLYTITLENMTEKEIDHIIGSLSAVANSDFNLIKAQEREELLSLSAQIKTVYDLVK